MNIAVCPEKQAASATSALTPIIISNNVTWADAFQFDRGDETWTLAGCDFELDVQRNSYDTMPLLSLSTADGRIIIADPIQRVIYFNVAPADIQAALSPGVYVYDLVMIDTAAVRTLLMHGPLTVQQGVTYPP
jgi:hypothetical protein